MRFRADVTELELPDARCQHAVSRIPDDFDSIAPASSKRAGTLSSDLTVGTVAKNEAAPRFLAMLTRRSHSRTRSTSSGHLAAICLSSSFAHKACN